MFFTTSALLLILTGCKKETEDPRNMIQPSFTYKESVSGNVVFEGKSDTGRSVEVYTWRFGDGEVANSYTGAYPHTYKKKGVYEVTLEIKDTSGKRESVSKSVSVYTASL